MIYDPIMIDMGESNKGPFITGVLWYVQENDERIHQFHIGGQVLRVSEDKMRQKFLEKTNGEEHF